MTGLTEEKDRLAEQLRDASAEGQELSDHLNNDVAPLLRTLGLALYQNNITLEDMRRGARDQQRAIQALSVLAADLNARKTKAERDAESAGQALSLLSLHHLAQDRVAREKIDHLLEDISRLSRHSSVLTGDLKHLEAEHQEALVLLRRQAGEIDTYKEQLADLAPLLSFFLENIPQWLSLGGHPPVPAEASSDEIKFLVFIIHLLNHENEVLRDKVGTLQEHCRALVLEKDHLAGSRQVIQDRLKELGPLFSFFWHAWLENALALAQSTSDRRRISTALKNMNGRLQQDQARLRTLTSDLDRSERDLKQARSELAHTPDGS